MKKILSILGLFFLGINFSSQAQNISYTTNTWKYCYQNVYNNQSEDCVDNDEQTVFNLNEEGTVLFHFTKDLVSEYYIKEAKYYPEHGTLSLKTVSDAGNKYLFVIDEAKRKIKVFFLNPEEEGRVAVFGIAAIEH